MENERRPNGKMELIHILIQVILWFLAGGTLFINQGRHAERLDEAEAQRLQLQIDIAVLKEKVCRLEGGKCEAYH